MELHVRFTVDATYCQRALDELGSMLTSQERAFLRRWHHRFPAAALVRGLCIFGIAVCTVGIGLSAFNALGCGLHETMTPTLWMLAFLLFLAAFESLRRSSEKLLNWMHVRTLERAGRRGPQRAMRFVRQARHHAPFEAGYSLQGDLLTYSRFKDGHWQHVWHRHLAKHCKHGMAIQGDYVIAIFARDTALFPSIVVLSNGSDELPAALNALGLHTTRLETN